MCLCRLVGRVAVLPTVVVAVTTKLPVEELPPGLQGFTRPDPEAGSGTYDEAHEVLQHEDGVVGGGGGGVARTGARRLPALPQVLLIEVARDDDGGGHGIEN